MKHRVPRPRVPRRCEHRKSLKIEIGTPTVVMSATGTTTGEIGTTTAGTATGTARGNAVGTTTGGTGTVIATEIVDEIRSGIAIDETRIAIASVRGQGTASAEGIATATGTGIAAEIAGGRDRSRTSSAQTAGLTTRTVVPRTAVALPIVEVLRPTVSPSGAGSQSGIHKTASMVCQIGFGISSSSPRHPRSPSWGPGSEASRSHRPW
mmetsp:Transcript_118428/g.297842  ORF Transcript_118428/g.297842 Transcript_118428/m.297842 type:complete len:208 (+) Transcript_118428:197-820(+)